MLEKKGVSPILCQTGAQTQGNGGPTGVGPPSAPSAQQTAICSQPAMNDTNNGLEPKRCGGSKGTTSASSSGPNTPLGDQMMAPMTASQDFVIIKSEDQMPPNAATNHCDNKTKLNVETQLRSNHMIDTKPNINTLNANVNMCGNRDNITANNGMKCRDNVMSCGANGAINGPINGMNCINNTSPLNHLLNDDKLTSFGNEFGIPMPVPTGNLPVPGDLPPFPLMSQPMNTRMRGRGPCGPPLAQGPRMPINAPLHSQPHNNMHQMVANNNMPPQKSSMTMESQYMQQQSQIFVFNTKVANDAADAVDKGSFASIIDYHCANPETKRLLEKFPLKAPINRGNCSAVWLNNMAQQKQGGRGLKPNVSNAHLMHPSMMKNSFGGPRESGPCNTSGPGPGGGLGGNWPNNMNNMCPNPNAGPNWSAPQQQMFAQNSDINPNNVFTNSPIGANIRGCPPFASNNFGPNPQMFNNSSNHGMGGPPHAGPPQPPQEIPDETLTEEQRQNRVKKLALLRSMQQQLCPEMMDPSLMGHMMRMPAPNQPMNASDFINDQNMYPMSESDPMANTDPHMNPSRMLANPNNTQNHTSMPPTSGAASLEWQKANFLDDRRRKSQANGQGVHNTNNSVPISHQSPLSQPSSALNSPNPCISQSPGSRIPPPPYNQGIRSHSSPHPASPVTGSLPMPSPRMQSPADSQFTSGARVSHTSPGPPTPSADSNSSLSGHWSKHMSVSSAPNTIPSNTSSSTAVKNSGRNQGSNNVTNIRANTPSSIGPSHSPSNVKKLPNLMTGKGLGADCSDLLINSGEPNRPLHPNDVPLMGPTVATNCSSPFICNKQEAALMPVPSPQQIQYLNTFEGQELTIQKQPNTSLRDTDLIAHASDLDIGFNNEFANSCQPFATNERMPNFPLMDGMNARFASNPQNPNMSGNQFEMSARFMTPPDNNQRFGGPVFDGSAPRMMNSHESQFRPQNMLCMPYPQMDNNMMRFSSPCDNLMPPRGRGPSDMLSNRFVHHNNDGMQPNPHFNATPMSAMNSGEPMNVMPFGANQSSGAGCMASVNNFNPQMDSGFSSSPLQNLQKMTPPYDIGPPNKGDNRMMSNGSLTHSQNPNGSITSVSQTQRTNNFDPISSMAAMGEPNVNSPMNAQHNSSGNNNNNMMNMSSIQMAANGPPPPGPPNMVNFHTSMSSMQGMQQNMTGEAMNGQYPHMNPNMTGGPQTVNNTYVNATMSIQQLNIQNVPNPNQFNPNLDQNMNVGHNMPITSGPPMNPGSGPMQMMPTNTSSKMPPNFGPRMAGPNNGPNFAGQPMNNTRGMNPMAYQQNPQMMRCSYNSPQIQIKPDAPNTIQYLPPRQQNPSVSSTPRTPSLMFLQRCEPPLTNLGNKLPTHNLQYFPANAPNSNNNNSMNFTRPPNMPNMYN